MEVTLLWNVLENRLAVTVSDLRSGETFVIDTEHSRALEVFLPPLRTRGVLDRGMGGVGDGPIPMTASCWDAGVPHFANLCKPPTTNAAPFHFTVATLMCKLGRDLRIRKAAADGERDLMLAALRPAAARVTSRSAPPAPSARTTLGLELADGRVAFFARTRGAVVVSRSRYLRRSPYELLGAPCQDVAWTHAVVLRMILV